MRRRFAAIEDWLPALVPTESPLDAFAGLKTIVWLPDDVSASAREAETSALQRWEALEDEDRPLTPPSERYDGAATVLGRLEHAHPVVEFAEAQEAADLGARPVAGFTVRGADLAPVASQIKKLARDGLRVALVVEPTP